MCSIISDWKRRMPLKEEIKEEAIRLGFDDCRFGRADSPEHRRHFEEWLAAGFHGEMNYLARNAEKRVDPQKVLPGARTIISLAVSYFTGDSRPATDGTGVVARYARFRDYHDVLGDRLKELIEFFHRRLGPEERHLWYVDTGPLLERDLAQRAGLGFAGKHTNLIHRRLGNWLFLAQIITTADCEPDPSEPNRCGTCSRCITACPTQAIVGPFQLDARRCISYLTIENKGPIPIEFREAIGSRVYGCDACLEVCPWNRFATEGRMMRAAFQPDLESPDLLELAGLDEAGFKNRFAGTPLLRTKRRGLVRNVCVVLGNVGNSDALPILERLTRDPEPLVAEHAAWARDKIVARRSPMPFQPEGISA
jgi:epoxyqueuosine reductase